MSAEGMLELDEMPTKLEATARKLPQAPERDELLRDVERFRARLVELELELKAKGK